MSNNNLVNLVFDALRKILINIEANAQYVFYTLSLVKTNTTNLTYYQHFINLLFIFIVVVIVYILYRDLVYRDASNIKRCRDIEDTIEINNYYEQPYVYRIYIIDKSLSRDILNNFSICLEYDFIKENTNVFFGKPENVNSFTFSDYVSETDSKNINKSRFSNAFSFFNLDKLDTEFLMYDNGEKSFYINKKIITGENYIYIVAESDNKKILKDKYAKRLSRFIRKYGFDNSTELSPIYNILYAIEHKKNSVSI